MEVKFEKENEKEMEMVMVTVMVMVMVIMNKWAGIRFGIIIEATLTIFFLCEGLKSAAPEDMSSQCRWGLKADLSRSSGGDESEGGHDEQVMRRG